MHIYIVILTVIVLSSCELPSNNIKLSECMNTANYDDQDISYQPSTFNEAWQWVSSNITYKHDPEGGHKQSPEETYALRTGDCEDYALSLAYFGHTLGLDIHVVTGINSKGSRHAINRYNGELIEPQCYGKIINPSDFTIIAEYTYKDAFYSPFIRSIHN